MMGEVSNFWSVRLYQKLEWADPHGLCTNDHFQPLFPKGGLILLAEDIFQDLRKINILVYWFLHFPQKKSWRLVLPPDAWKLLQERLQQAENDEEIKFLLSIIVSIKKINSIDDYFQEESLRASQIHEPNSNVVSLSVAGYGSRSEDDCPVVLKGLSQQERDMDHVAEAFAGWALTKSACFRRMIIISSVQSNPLRDRWRSWSHIILMDSDDFFAKFKVRENVIMENLLKERRSNQAVNSPAEITPGTPATPADPPVGDPPVGADPSDPWKWPSEFRQSGSYR
jgi:chromo domain-containing protein 1